MPIRKQEYYEGAALHVLARKGVITSIRYDAPLFWINERLFVLLKYSTKVRSPWGFTFTPEEQRILGRKRAEANIVIGLICGGDGIAAIPFDRYCAVVPAQESSVHVACYRAHNEHYEVSGPKGTLGGKIAPADWNRILDC
jgi:hypothetical protein